MPRLELTINNTDKKRLLRKLNVVNPSKQPATLKRAMINAGLAVERRLKVNVSNRILRRRTGTLAKSIGSRFVWTADGMKMVIGSGARTGDRVKYATILETGGVIKPKRAKYLAVPLPRALTEAGATKFPSATDYPNTFVKKSKSGKLIIFQKNGQRLDALFVLKKSVKIKRTQYMSTTAKQMKRKIFRIMSATIDRELRRR